jgi:hypothetical protein
MLGVQEAMSIRHKHVLKNYLGGLISLEPVLPFSAQETAESYIFRLTDLMNPMQLPIPSTDILSRAIILTLLHCAARLFPDQQLSAQASDLIGCATFRGILQIGFGAKFDKVAQQHALSKVGLEPTSAENWSQNSGLFGSCRKMEANLVWENSNLLYLLARLYETYKTVLQNSCAPPKMGEYFMFHNYTALVAHLSLPDKAVLVTLLPDVFHWSEARAYDDSTSTVPERTLLAQPPKESQSSSRLREWLPNVEFTPIAAFSPSTYADSCVDDSNTKRLKANSERQASDEYQDALTSGIILEILKVNAETGILPKSFGPRPVPTIDEDDIKALAQGESGKIGISE